eukprot:TRINITY_DN3968_c3_g1_i1.p4 TRINITY_DN3968_c3_g1~~TRINITY_DN3968_c3_g1_i1.p4  ORF type:complete len:133 (+),score=53.20 TRINITY_DN3968_c3_g1_i1:175-573(+)
MEEESQKKQQERKKRKKENLKKRKQQEAEFKQQEELRAKQQAEMDAVAQRKRATEKALAGMSDRERRAYAAEQRARVQQSVQSSSSSSSSGGAECEWCGKPMGPNVVPYSRLTYKYCSMPCVTEHKKTLETV